MLKEEKFVSILCHSHSVLQIWTSTSNGLNLHHTIRCSKQLQLCSLRFQVLKSIQHS